MSVSIQCQLVSDVVVVDISGRLCFLEVSLLRQINELLEQKHRNFVLNLTDVPYIDSFGLGQLVTIWTSIRSRDGQLILLRPTDHVRQLLKISKLDSIFQASTEEPEAVRSARTSFAALA
jgi:anti-sigma B factor antagonist